MLNYHAIMLPNPPSRNKTLDSSTELIGHLTLSVVFGFLLPAEETKNGGTELEGSDNEDIYLHFAHIPAFSPNLIIQG